MENLRISPKRRLDLPLLKDILHDTKLERREYANSQDVVPVKKRLWSLNELKRNKFNFSWLLTQGKLFLVCLTCQNFAEFIIIMRIAGFEPTTV